MKSKHLIPKAQFGTGIVKRGLRWLSNHAVPTREQTLFEVQNQQQLLKRKPRELQDLQQDLKDLGYYTKSVDNQMGPGTRNAIQQAQADGYKIDMNNFTISGKKRLQRKTSNNGKIIYLHYPDFVSDKGSSQIFESKTAENIASKVTKNLKVGHTALILLDNKNNATYYEYGRYDSGSIIGHKKEGKGNWRKIKLPSIKNGENIDNYLQRINNFLPERNESRMQYIVSNNANIDKATQYITDEANNENRKSYGLNNTCATQANEVLRHSSNYGLFNRPKHEIDSNSDLSGSMFNTLAPGGSHQYFQTAFSKYGDYVKEINKNS